MNGPARSSQATQRDGLELIDRAHDQLLQAALCPCLIHEMAAVRRHRDIALRAGDAEHLTRRRRHREAHQIRCRRRHWSRRHPGRQTQRPLRRRGAPRLRRRSSIVATRSCRGRRHRRWPTAQSTPPRCRVVRLRPNPRAAACNLFRGSGAAGGESAAACLGRQRGPGRLAAEHRRERVGDVVTLEGPRAGEHLVEHAAERPKVAALIDGLGRSPARDSCRPPCRESCPPPSSRAT